MNYYTTIILLSWFALGILCILVWENDRMTKANKHLFYLTFFLMALAAFAEWLGVQLNGKAELPKQLLQAVKCVDYILTPVAGGMLAIQLKNRSVWRKMLIGILVVNTIFQIIASFTGLMVIIDANNYYSHGPLYSIYIIAYVLVAFLLIIEFIIYGQRFRKQNKISLYAILAFVILGIIMQEFLGNNVRTAYITLALAIALLFIHYSEFSQLEADEHIQEQKIQITKDALTGVYSRHAYAKKLKKLNSLETLPQNLVAFSFDVNGLKSVNDNFGHEAGDELICGAAECIVSVFEKYGKCYRAGGDEFIVLTYMESEQISDALNNLKQKALKWKGEKIQSLHLAIGFAKAYDYPDISVEKLIGIADKAMYKSKAEYYQTMGIDRRRNN